MNAPAPAGEMTSPVHLEFAALAARHPGATIQDIGGGAYVVFIPSLALPEGWNKKATAIHFVVPAGYPYAQPDCFHADLDLRLADGRMPTNTGQNAVANLGATLWFSWHLGRPWKAGRDTLSVWLNVITDRFQSLA
jgi:hypothetical protein